MSGLELLNQSVNKASNSYETCSIIPERSESKCQNLTKFEKTHFYLQATVIILTSLCVILSSTVIVLAIFWGSASFCQQGIPVIGRNMDDPEVFDELTPSEYEAVKNYLFKQPKLNLTPYELATVNSSYIFLVDLLIPLKSAVLRQLDRGDNKPKRNAKVILFRGDLNPPRVEEYHVGPLPIPEYHTLVTNPSYTTPRIPFPSRPMSRVEQHALDNFLLIINRKLYPLLNASYSLSYHNCNRIDNCIIYHGNTPRGSASGDRRTWFSGFRDVEGLYLHPLGIHIEINHVSVKTHEWKVERIVYNGVVYPSVFQLLQQYIEGEIKLTRISDLAYTEYKYSSLLPRVKHSQKYPIHGPKLVEPEGRRYSIVGNHIKYMKWDIQIRMRSVSGLQLFDVRFDEERILYELSMQEIIMIQAGKSPIGVNYLSAELLGSQSYELLPGVDCPQTAVFRDMNKYSDSGNARNFRNVVCIFEHNANIPLIRHVAVDDLDQMKTYGGLTNHFLVVRTVHTAWNSDFIVDYYLTQNGAIEVKVSISGYTQTVFGTDGEKKGNRIHENIVSNIQQYLFHFKADLDINGINNRFAFLKMTTNEEVDNFNAKKHSPKISYEENILYREHDIIFEDRHAKNRFDVFYNDKATSKFGSKRSYRIVNLSPAESILEDDVMDAARWAKYPIAITQHKDAEDMSTSIYAQNDPWDPVVDFERFLRNNESVIDQDLVAWVAMGTINIPHTEDVPVLSISDNFVHFQLLPFNYFTENPSSFSENIVHISAGLSNENNDNVVKTINTSVYPMCVQKDIDYDEYNGRWQNISNNS